ncbi:MAG: 2-iminoacetate synthase ThiH [Deltaproteobacteria bacterium]|nr:MAG: 2-iminoacetate synthase ThiH [Deltaproteobacteria bacterium]
MFKIPPFSDLVNQVNSSSADAVKRSLRADHLNANDLASLLSPAADQYLEDMAKRSADVTALRFGKTTQIYAPLYVSSFCTNRCSYCGFSADNKIERRILTLDEAEAEAMLLHQRGFNHILLVSGEAPAKLGVDYLEKLALLLRDRFAAISIEVQPLSSEEYARLFTAGITSVAIYQETYDRKVYDKVHLSGQKCDFDYRLDTPARAAAGGMREVGIGTLLGLSDWRAEGLALGLHLAWLRKNYWRTALTVSFPRLRPAAGEFQPLYQVTERDLSHLIFALRLFDPDVGIILSTREEARYRNGMIGLGPTRYSAGSCTAPGGYSNPEVSGEQFAIGDHRNINEVCAAIKQKGFDPVRKDWDAGFQLQ